MTNREQGYAAAGGVALLTLATHAPLLLGQASPIWDALEFFGPYQMLIGDYVRSGHFLLWNPFISFGSPDAIEPQVGAFSPIVLVFGAVFGGSRRGFEIYWLVMWLLGPLGVLRLARHLRTPVWGAYSVAVAWALSGFYTGHAEHTAYIVAVSSLPWILWRLDVAAADGRMWPAVEAGALWGLAALAGYPGLILLNACFAALWSLGRSPRMADAVKAIAVMAVTGLVVLSPTYVSFLVEGRGYSHRAGALPFDVAVENNALHPLALITLISPGLALASVYEYTDISTRSLYVGPVVVVLAAIALTARRRFRWLLLSIGLLFLAAALGHSLPVRGWLYALVPPTRYFRNAGMFRVYVMLALAVLALFGASDIQAMIESRSRPSRRAWMVGALVAVTALGVWAAGSAMVPAVRTGAIVQLLQPLAGWSLVAGLCVAAAFRSGPIGMTLPAMLAIIATVDAVASAVVMRPVMYGTATTQWQGLDAQREAPVTITARGLARVVDNGNNFTFAAKVPAASGYAPLAGPLVREYLADPVLLDAAVGADRVWFSPTTTEVAHSNACLAAVREAAERLGAPPLVIHPRSSMTAGVDGASGDCRGAVARLPAAQRLRGAFVQVDAYAPDRLRLQVRVEEPGWVLVTDSWSRGWSAVVNGQPSEVVGGNFLFRAVRVGPGTNTIDFRFRPFGYPWLLVISWGTLAAVLVISLRRRSRVRGDDARRPEWMAG